MRLSLSLLILFCWLTAYCKQLYLEPGNDKLPLPCEFKSTVSPSPATLIDLGEVPENRLTISSCVINLHGNLEALHTYTAPDGRRIATRRPGMEYLLVNELTDTIRVQICSLPPTYKHSDAPEEFSVQVLLPSGAVVQGVMNGTKRRPVAQKSGWHYLLPAVITLQVNPAEEQGTLAVVEGSNHPEVLWHSGDNEELKQFLATPLTLAGWAAMPGGRIRMLRASISSLDNTDELITSHTLSSLQGHIDASRDPYEGWWSTLDFSIDDSLISPGGNYRFALIENGKGGYLLIYVDGADVNASAWSTGMIKARLTPTQMPGAFRASWIDAEGSALDSDCAVRFDSTQLLTVQFPHMAGTLRLHKIPSISPESH